MDTDTPLSTDEITVPRVLLERLLDATAASATASTEQAATNREVAEALHGVEKATGRLTGQVGKIEQVLAAREKREADDAEARKEWGAWVRGMVTKERLLWVVIVGSALGVPQCSNLGDSLLHATTEIGEIDVP